MSFVNCDNLPDHVVEECVSFRKGGYKFLAVIEQDHTVSDWTNASQWQTNITSGKIRIISNVKAQIPEPSEVNTDNPVACGAPQILDGWDWTAEWTDANVNQANNDFYQQLNKKRSYLVLYNCDRGEIEVIVQDITFAARPIKPDSDRAYQSYHAVAKWSTDVDEFPVIYTAPSGIFE